MIDWTEQNFLERLTPQLRQKSGTAVASPCPDAETLGAVFSGEASQPEHDAVVEHLSHCADCADLGNRLVDFGTTEPAEPELAWNQTRTRLDNWLESFLRSEAAQIRLRESGKLSWNASGRGGIWNFWGPTKILWALGAAAAVALVVGGGLVLEHRREEAHQVQMAANRSAPGKFPAPGAERPEATPGEGEPTTSPLPATGLPSEPGPIHPGGTSPGVPSSATPRNPAGETARITPPRSSNPVSNPAATPTAPGWQNPTATTPPEPAAPALIRRPQLKLEPSSRFLIVLSTIRLKRDGTFEFRGVLLPPLPQVGPVPLHRGTEVVGEGIGYPGQIALAVTELDDGAVRYSLKEGTGAMSAQTPGAGGGVDFHRSQVLEMRPVTEAVYEQVSSPVEPAGPLK